MFVLTNYTAWLSNNQHKAYLDRIHKRKIAKIDKNIEVKLMDEEIFEVRYLLLYKHNGDCEVVIVKSVANNSRQHWKSLKLVQKRLIGCPGVAKVDGTWDRSVVS